MSYFVIKGPEYQGQYLCWMPGHDCPQWWHKRADAKRFPDEESAWKYLTMTLKKYRDASGNYVGRVVRVNTVRDWQAERAMLRAEVARLRSGQSESVADGNASRGTNE